MTTLTVEKKDLTLERRANPNGEYIQITERSHHGYFNAIKIPSTGKEQLITAIELLFDETEKP